MKKLDEIPNAVVLSEEEIGKILKEIGWSKIIEAIAETFIEETEGRAVSPPKTIFQIKKHNNDYRVMPAYLPVKHPDFCGTKIISACPDNPGKYGKDCVNGVYILNDAKTQDTLMICKANKITAYRTAAATAVAVRELAKKDAKTLGIIGCGVQAYYHVPAILAVRDIERIFINDKSEDAEDKLFGRICQYRRFVQKSTKKEMMKECDVVVTLTPSIKPFIFPEDLPDRELLICSIGGDSEHKLEIAPEVLCYVDSVCDSYKQVLHTGTILRAIRDKWIGEEELISLGDYMTGEMKLHNNFKTRLFLSTGVALEDLAIAILIYNNT